jgi:hypothetical protein
LIPDVANGFEGPAVITCDEEVVATALTQQATVSVAVSSEVTVTEKVTLLLLIHCL